MDCTGDAKVMTHLPADVRLEMLVGMLTDQLAPARELVGALHLKSNASVTTRGKLEHLNGMTGLLWQRLIEVSDEVKAIRDDGRTITSNAQSTSTHDEGHRK